ncbi:MAG TPA: ABC transporter permease [Thermoplasmata archaeon]|nr:ABC transporter permease [Thermoplasmata archaeon]
MRLVPTGFPQWVVANLKMFFRDRGTLFWALLFPIIFMGLLGLGFGRADPVEFQVGIVDEDQTPWSERLWTTLSNESLPFVLTNYTDRDAASAAVEAGDLDVALVIPSNFDTFMANQTNGSANETLVLPAWFGVDAQGSGAVSVQALQEAVDAFFRFWTRSPPKLGVGAFPLSARNLEYIDFLAPGILAMSIMQSGVYGLALFIVTSREKRILKRLHATPAGAAFILAGRIVPALLISFIQTAVLLSVAVLAFGVQIVGNLGILLIAAGFGAVVFISLGFLVSSVSKSADSAENLTGIVTLPMFFLGGVFIPIDRLPEAVQYLAYAMPLTYFSDAVRQIMVNGAGLGEVAVDLGVLAIFALAVFALAVKLFRWE